VPCVVGEQSGEAAEVIASVAEAQSAPLYRKGGEWQWTFRNDTAFYSSPKRRDLPFAPGLAGTHQYDNAAMAIACVDHLPSYDITDAHIATGLANVSWPARLQKLTSGRLRDLLPPHIELWLDGGHNPQ